MKDKLGHGSNPRGSHAAGIDAAVPQPKVHPSALSTILNNPNGFSVHPTKGTVPNDGFMVSHHGRSQFLDRNQLAGPAGKQILSEYVKRNADLLRSDSDNHIGGWTDPDTGKVVLDVSQHVKDRKLAEHLGRQRDQKAVWDVAHKREIDTGGRGDIQ